MCRDDPETLSQLLASLLREGDRDVECQPTPQEIQEAIAELDEKPLEQLGLLCSSGDLVYLAREKDHGT